MKAPIAMKAFIAEVAGKNASPSRGACGTDVPIQFETVTRSRCHRVRPIIGCRFAMDTVSDGRIAICDCLLRFANRVSTKLHWGETGGDSSHKHGPQSPGRPSGRELGIRTVEGGPARLKQNAAAGTRIGRDSGASELRIAICYGMRGFANWDKAGAGPWPRRRSRQRPRGQSWQRGLTGGRSVCRRVLAALCGRWGRQSDRSDPGVGLLSVSHQGNDQQIQALFKHCRVRPSESADP
jgi:hypothetical protein